MPILSPVVVTIGLTTNCTCTDQGTLYIRVYGSDGVTLETYISKRISISKTTKITFNALPFSLVNQEKTAYITLDVPNNLENPIQTKAIDLVPMNENEFIVDFVTGKPVISTPSKVELTRYGTYVFTYDSYDFATTVFYIQKDYPVIPIHTWRFKYSGLSPQPLSISSAYLLLDYQGIWEEIPKKENSYYFPLNVISLGDEYGFSLAAPPIINSETGGFNAPNPSLEGVVTDLVLPLTMDRTNTILMTIRIEGIGQQQISIILSHHLLFYRSFFGNCLEAHFCIKQKNPIHFSFPSFYQRTWEV